MKAAIKMVASKGYKLSDEEIINAVKAAWQEMNVEMIEAGIKDAENK